jgi:hypothetical protein
MSCLSSPYLGVYSVSWPLFICERRVVASRNNTRFPHKVLFFACSGNEGLEIFFNKLLSFCVLCKPNLFGNAKFTEPQLAQYLRPVLIVDLVRVPIRSTELMSTTLERKSSEQKGWGLSCIPATRLGLAAPDGCMNRTCVRQL